MGYSVTKTFRFCYAHRLIGDAGKCWRLHGHTALVEIEVVGSEELNKDGMVMNFETLKQKVGCWIENELDHRTILHKEDPIAKFLAGHGEDCIVMEANPTAENLARLIFESVKKLEMPISKVRFWESDTSMAEYTG